MVLGRRTIALTKLRSRQKEYLVIVDAEPGKLQVKQAC
jgi:hypothetical protein